MGGGGCTVIGNVLNPIGSGDAPLRVGVVGRVPADWEGGGRIFPSGDMVADGADTTAERRWDGDIPSPRGGDGIVSSAVDIHLCRPSPKQCCSIYYNKTNYVSVSVSREASGGPIFEAVVGSGETQYSGDTVGGTGGRVRKGIR